MKNMLNFKNFTAEELMDILNLALDMKKNPEKYSESLRERSCTHFLRRLQPEHSFHLQQVLQSLAVHITTSFGRIRISFWVSLYQRLSMYAEM